MEEDDPISKLSNRIKEIKGIKSNLEYKYLEDKKSIERIGARIEKVSESIEEKKGFIEENEVKAERYNRVIEESEKVIRKVFETSIRLDKTLQNEIINSGNSQH